MAKPDIRKLFSGVSKDARADITALALPIIRDMQESHRLWQELQEVRQGMDDLRAGAPGTPQPPRAVLSGSLKEIREAVGFSQRDVAQRRGTEQQAIALVEHKSDMLLFTLRDHVKALGGSLKLVVDFANEKSVTVGIKPEGPLDLPRRDHKKALSTPAPEEADVLDAMLKRLLPEDREKLATLVEIIAEQKKRWKTAGRHWKVSAHVIRRCGTEVRDNRPRLLRI